MKTEFTSLGKSTKKWYEISSLRYADVVSTGDEVMVDRNDDIVPAKVIKVLSLKKQGDDFLKHSGTGQAWFIWSHSSARISFELSGNLN